MTSSALTGNTSGLASATSPGLVGITTQTFAGVKTFSNGLAFDSSSLSDVQATILGLKQYLHGTTYNGGNAPTVASAQAGFAVQRAIFIPYQCQDGSWRCKFNICAGITAASLTSIIMTVNGIVAKNSTNYLQSVSGYQNTAGNAVASATFVGSNSNQIVANFVTATVTYTNASGDVELNAKPTWAY
jgi:hypothetical protein